MMDLLPVSPAKSSGNWMMTKDVLCRGHVVVDLYVFGWQKWADLANATNRTAPFTNVNMELIL
jgi:hypothetical protein